MDVISPAWSTPRHARAPSRPSPDRACQGPRSAGSSADRATSARSTAIRARSPWDRRHPVSPSGCASPKASGPPPRRGPVPSDGARVGPSASRGGGHTPRPRRRWRAPSGAAPGRRHRPTHGPRRQPSVPPHRGRPRAAWPGATLPSQPRHQPSPQRAPPLRRARAAPHPERPAEARHRRAGGDENEDEHRRAGQCGDEECAPDVDGRAARSTSRPGKRSAQSASTPRVLLERDGPHADEPLHQSAGHGRSGISRDLGPPHDRRVLEATRVTRRRHQDRGRRSAAQTRQHDHGREDLDEAEEGQRAGAERDGSRSARDRVRGPTAVRARRRRA